MFPCAATAMTAAFLVLLTGCGRGTAPAASNTPRRGGTPVPQAAEVRIDQGAFHPRTVTVGTGATVTFANDDVGAHTATAAADEPFRYDSGILAPGGSFTQTYPDPGTYDFVCTLHPTMRGTIIVEEA